MKGEPIMDEAVLIRKPAHFSDERARLWKRWLPTLIALIFLSTIFWVEAVIVKHNVTAQVREEMTVQFEQELAAYKQQQAEEAQASYWLSGEASREAAINTDAIWLARIGQGVMNTYKAADADDARKVMICAVCRVLSGGEFSGIGSIEDAVNQPGQWWGYSENLSYTQELFQIALEISGIYHRGEAMPCSSDMVYAGWNGQEIVLRNQWEANSKARYY